MKKLTTILFSVVMLLSLCFGLVGCDKGDDTQGNETIDFTSANYGDYIAINVEFDTPEIVSVYASTGAVIGYHLLNGGARRGYAFHDMGNLRNPTNNDGSVL